MPNVSPGRERADDKRAEPAGAGVIGRHSGGDADEQGQREDGEREQQPA